MEETTYEEWRANAPRWLARSKAYNRWRLRAKKRLLSDIAPRIAALSALSAGRHYDLEQRLGRLIVYLATPLKISSDYFDEAQDRLASMVINEVIVESLIRGVVAAEVSAKASAAKNMQVVESTGMRIDRH